VAAGQLGLTGGAQPIFFPNPQKTSIQLLLEAQQHKIYAQTTPLDNAVSSLFFFVSFILQHVVLDILLLNYFKILRFFCCLEMKWRSIGSVSLHKKRFKKLSCFIKTQKPSM
jgi:hypothetical protein